jgi:hypothetical protein
MLGLARGIMGSRSKDKKGNWVRWMLNLIKKRERSERKKYKVKFLKSRLIQGPVSKLS